MRRFWLALLFIFLGAFSVRAEVDDLKAQPKTTAPVGMTQEQFDTLVKSVTDAVTKAIQEQTTPTAETHHAAFSPNEHNSLGRALASIVERAPAVVAGIPGMVFALERMPARLDRSAQGGLNFVEFMLALIAALLITALLEWLVRKVSARKRHELAVRIPDEHGLRALLGLTLIEALRLAAVIGVTHVIIAVWFSNGSFQSTVMGAALDAWIRWRIFAVLTEIIFRPKLASARLAPVDDAAATKIAYWIVLTSAIVSGTKFYASLFAAPAVLAAALMVTTAIVTATYIGFLYQLYTPLSQWFSGLVNTERGSASFNRILARHWFALAIPLLLFSALMRLFGAVTANAGIATASAITVNVVIAFIFFETVMVFIARRPLDEQSLASQMRPFILRAIQVFAIIAAIFAIANIWAVSGLSLLKADEWNNIIDSWSTVAFILIGSFFAWEIVSFVSSRYSTHNVADSSQEDSLAASTGATRLQTLMPPFRVAMAVGIIVTSLLMVLSSLGINTTPLIAGASVIGLAISFGSQTLVKDIVSGIFFLADDAFRVGEYIDCKSVKGTVEGFTLRSLKLRHQNGQIHTIPFGQLGQITNFSRDWSTVKFNLRFARDIDVDTLRKATKKLGQELVEDPELKDQFIAPLKLQGVADIEDNAIIMRFKFTVKPVNPTFIQRLAIKRMLLEFPALGLKFASAPNLVLQAPQLPEPLQVSSAIDSTQAGTEPQEHASTASKIA
jgi:small-conductance mechanosensitive channel